MKRLFVRSGGGLPGIDVHIGYWLALEHYNIIADECIGTSAGAIVSAIDASGACARDIRVIVEKLRDNDIRSERWFWRLRGLLNINWFLDNKPILKLFNDLILNNGKYFRKKCSVCATKWDDLNPVFFNSDTFEGDFRQCVLASMSIAGVFPRVKIGDFEYIDGGVRENLPVPENIDDYDEVWLLVASARPESYNGRDNIITSLKRQADALMLDQIEEKIKLYEQNTKVRILWYKYNSPKGALRFNHQLIENAFHYARHEIKRYI